MKVSRREFLQQATVGAALSGVVASTTQASVSTEAINVLLFLEGGIDPLSVLVPRASRRYVLDRPTMAVPQRQLLSLSDRWGLHPSLRSLHRCFAEDRLQLLLTSTDIESSHMLASARLAKEYCRDLSSVTPARSLPIISAEPASLTVSWPAALRSYFSPMLSQTRSRAYYVSMLSELMGQCSGGKLIVAIRDHDCHSNAATHIPSQLERLDAVFSAVLEALKALGHGSSASMLVCSELGRSYTENARGGTDHGEVYLAMRASAGISGISVADVCEEYLQ